MMTKQRKYFFVVASLFLFVLLSSWMLGPESIVAQIIRYGYMCIFMCYWLWSAFFVGKGNAGFFKKIKDSKDEKEEK